MRAKEFRLLTEAIEEGIGFGWVHALKHLEMGDVTQVWLDQHEESIKEKLYDDILSAICERFEFNESDET